MLEGLQAILDKQAVLSTVNADDLLQKPNKVEEAYQRHVATFVPMGDISSFIDRFVRNVVKAKTPKGMIVAPYGYGKTSTLAFLWHECEERDLIAVPPFYCSNLLDILNATYGWVRYRLEHSQPALVTDLESAYKKYTKATVDQMAKLAAEEHGLARITAKGLLEDMIERESLVLKLTPSNLLFFLDKASDIIDEAGFQGLAILPDEFQQYINRGVNLDHTIQEFRELIWGLDTRENTVGVIISIPDTTEGGVVEERGKDILHRLKKDDLYYRLEEIYTREFPTQLWDSYKDAFQLGIAEGQIIDRTTLKAIGQITEREDLGEGPRTVVDSFKRAIYCYQDLNRSYTPIDLIEDFLESNIRFQSQANNIKRVTRQVLSSTIADTPEKKRAVKLMAAFPRGCPVPVQKDYNAYETINTLSKEAHGELMTLLVEGYTLLGLQRGEVPTQTVDIIIIQFWRSYNEDDKHLQEAIRAFTTRLLPRFFKQRRGTSATGWGNIVFEPSTHGSQVALIEGTFDTRFPRRRLRLQAGYKQEQIQPLLQGVDLQFDFLFQLADQESSGALNLPNDKTIHFDLNVRQRVSGPLPSDIQKLQEFVNPEFVTPLMMLSLIDYFDRWEDIKETKISESDRSEIEFLINRLLNHSEQILLNRYLAESVDPVLRYVGGRMLEELFTRQCTKLFPDYHTLYLQAHYQKVINAYINAMRDMTLKERRGSSSLQDTKEALATRFGLGSVATFNNRARNEYQEMMRIVEWTGRGDSGRAEIFLTLHPIEEVILNQIIGSTNQRELDGQWVPTLDANEVANLGQSLGYRNEETLLALELLAARGYVRFDTQSKLVYLVQVGPDPAKLESRMQQKLEEVKRIPSELLNEEQAQEFESDLIKALERLDEATSDEEELDDIQALLVDLEKSLGNILSARRESLRQDLNNKVLEIGREIIKLRQSNILDRNVEGQVAFVMHLNELRQKLSDQKRKLANQYESLKGDLNRALEQANSGPVSWTISLYKSLQEGIDQQNVLDEERQRLNEQKHHLEQWITLLKDTDRFFNALERIPDLQRDLTREVIPEIQAHLTKQRLDGLDAWEIFQVKVSAIEEELEKRRRHGNDRFGEVKEKYESFLRSINIGDYRPMTRYTYGEDKGSYQDLYQEVKTKISERLDEIGNDLKQSEDDLLKAEHIQELAPKHRTVVKHVKKRVEEVREQLKSLLQALTLSLIINSGDELYAYGEQVNSMAQAVMTSLDELKPVLYTPRELSEAEQELLDALGRRSNVDPTDLFVSLRQDGRDLNWQDLIELIDHLYRKNRILIRMTQRG